MIRQLTRGSVQAVDLNTGKQTWQHETHLPWSGATDLRWLDVQRQHRRHFMAFDAKTGKVLWSSDQLSSGIIGVPTTYGRRQTVCRGVGGMGVPAATPGSLTHEEDVEIMAFILKQNGYPAGSNELVYEDAEKSRVPIRYYGK